MYSVGGHQNFMIKGDVEENVLKKKTEKEQSKALLFEFASN